VFRELGWRSACCVRSCRSFFLFVWIGAEGVEGCWAALFSRDLCFYFWGGFVGWGDGTPATNHTPWSHFPPFRRSFQHLLQGSEQVQRKRKGEGAHYTL